MTEYTDGPEQSQPKPQETPIVTTTNPEAPDVGTGAGTEYTDGPEPPQDR
jgi:hypothetical protein